MSATFENTVCRVDRERRKRCLPGRIPRRHVKRSSCNAPGTVGNALEFQGGNQAAVRCALRRACSWRAPPNWSAIDWHQELDAVAAASAWQAELDFDPERHVPLAGFIYHRVLARALTRYRQEWRYGMSFVGAPAEVVEQIVALDPAPSRAIPADESLRRILAQLPAPEHWLLDQLFWRHRTETSIATELHISQPAVSKRKRAALRHSRVLLRDAEK